MYKNYILASFHSFFLLYIPLYMWFYYVQCRNKKFIFFSIYLLYLCFFSFLHNYYWEKYSIFGFIDRSFVLIVLLLCFILFRSVIYINHIFIWLSSIGCYILCWVPYFIDYEELFHILFRVIAFNYLFYLLLKYYKEFKNYKPLIYYSIFQIIFYLLLRIKKIESLTL